ncbi:hypothetical protein Tsp_01466 [Trichinella spiralis]|uniref:hypothetical protein n=1 Tax=Trichinella spiralis TaxID=6334 RepID=UPI0001EFB8C1|nr:hypothetical protein Tsp_01466 [Trichinella spiralis]
MCEPIKNVAAARIKPLLFTKLFYKDNLIVMHTVFAKALRKPIANYRSTAEQPTCKQPLTLRNDFQIARMFDIFYFKEKSRSITSEAGVEKISRNKLLLAEFISFFRCCGLAKPLLATVGFTFRTLSVVFPQDFTFCLTVFVFINT